MYPVLSQLQAIKEMEDYAEATMSANFVSMLNKWNLQDRLVRESDFQYIEPVAAQRIVMLNSYLKMHHSDDLKNYLVSMLLDFTDLARKEGHFRVATRALENLKCMSNLKSDVQIQMQIADAQLSWAINDKMVTKHILSKLCKNENINPKLRSAALKLSGQYMIETFSENRLVIISDYFLKSLDIIKNVERTPADYHSILDTYDKIAQFADKGYQQVTNILMVSQFCLSLNYSLDYDLHEVGSVSKKIVNMEKAKETAENIHKQRKKTQDETKVASIHVKQSNIDETEIKNSRLERDQFLKLALKYYLRNLVHCDENNIRIFRVMALFLENRDNEVISEQLQIDLPIYKYIMILPQIIPHITENNADLYNKKDREFSGSDTNTSSNDARVSAAINLLNKLKRREELSDHIIKLQQLSQALIELAYYPGPQMANSNSVHSFRHTYKPLAGINHPKRITCRGTDGKERSQLVKGKDDLRQDAVMQQVFSIMNSLLATNKQTRHLLIRTYKIVPLSMRSGVLEWLDDCITIGEYLVGLDKPGRIRSTGQWTSRLPRVEK
ncbi:hypothetical protein NQ317_013562 [Molorchus minor]|uniref:PI3K/PI4K catalytic domain-containing protein n=1 Tax=Molorchus minor TaxID=1323400 RepID=A0ABQ9JIM9_9CUCU|nr:hypothetical protein NQ317_013562 [Molorchus minor]